MHFKPNKLLHSILLGESGKHLILVHPNSLHEIIGHANIQGAVSLTRKDVHVKAHRAWPWMPAFAGMSGEPGVSRALSLKQQRHRRLPLRREDPNLSVHQQSVLLARG